MPSIISTSLSPKPLHSIPHSRSMAVYDYLQWYLRESCVILVIKFKSTEVHHHARHLGQSESQEYFSSTKSTYCDACYTLRRSEKEKIRQASTTRDITTVSRYGVGMRDRHDHIYHQSRYSERAHDYCEQQRDIGKITRTKHYCEVRNGIPSKDCDTGKYL